MHDFLKFFDEKVHDYPMHLEISYSEICDYAIHIYKKGCADNGGDIEILYVQNCDIELVFAKAHVLLKERLLKEIGGY